MPIVPASSDDMLIDVTEPSEVCLWTQRLGCNEAQLRTVVAAVGPVANDVLDHLGQPIVDGPKVR